MTSRLAEYLTPFSTGRITLTGGWGVGKEDVAGMKTDGKKDMEADSTETHHIHFPEECQLQDSH